VYSRKNLELAWEKVQKNRGSAGIDEVTIAAFEERKEDSLDLLHRKLRDGTYQPQPVKRVEIAKADGGVRKLGIPAVLDRVCQQALVQRMGPIVEPMFLDSSYGDSPGALAPGRDAQGLAGAERGIRLDRGCRSAPVVRHHRPRKANRLNRRGDQ